MRLKRTPLLVLALLGIGVAVPALAQQPSGYPAACEASKVSKGDVDRAHTVFLSGKGFLDESNYDKAIGYFKDAYSIDCSVHAILPIIATAYERKGDKGSAVQALQEYLKRVPGASDREVIERRIKNLQDQMTAVPVVTTAPSATATAPASATVVASSPTSTATTTAPTATATSAPPDTAGGHGVAPWIVVGVGGAAVLTGVVLYIVGAGKVSNAESICGPAHKGCPVGSPAIEDGNSGRTLEMVGGIAGGVGVAAVAGGLIWHFLEPTSSATSATSGAQVAPVVTPGYAGISLGGRF